MALLPMERATRKLMQPNPLKDICLQNVCVQWVTKSGIIYHVILFNFYSSLGDEMFRILIDIALWHTQMILKPQVKFCRPHTLILNKETISQIPKQCSFDLFLHLFPSDFEVEHTYPISQIILSRTLVSCKL